MKKALKELIEKWEKRKDFLHKKPDDLNCRSRYYEISACIHEVKKILEGENEKKRRYNK